MKFKPLKKTNPIPVGAIYFKQNTTSFSTHWRVVLWLLSCFSTIFRSIIQPTKIDIIIPPRGRNMLLVT